MMIIYPKYPQKIPKKKDYECKHCNKKLSSYKNLWRHLKTCKEKLNDEDKKNLLDLINILNKKPDKDIYTCQMCSSRDETYSTHKVEMPYAFKL